MNLLSIQILSKLQSKIKVNFTKTLLDTAEFEREITLIRDGKDADRVGTRFILVDGTLIIMSSIFVCTYITLHTRLFIHDALKFNLVLVIII